MCKYIFNEITHTLARCDISSSKNHGALWINSLNHVNDSMYYFHIYFLFKVRQVQNISFVWIHGLAIFFLIFILYLFVAKYWHSQKMTKFGIRTWNLIVTLNTVNCKMSSYGLIERGCPK